MMDLKFIFYGRGGQGAKSSADILAKSAIYQGYYAQSVSKFGAEKSGTPVFASLKISDQNIVSHEPIEKCDILIILDDTLIVSNKNLINFIDSNSKLNIILINTKNKKIIEDLEKSVKSKKLNSKIEYIDATGIAIKNIQKNTPNTTLLSKLLFLLNNENINLSKQKLIDVISEIFEHNSSIIEKNIKSINEAYC